MALFEKRQEEQVMGSFILSELRDLRKGMEGRDGELRGEIAAVRDAVATLSESVTRSHSKVDGIRSDVENMTSDVKRLRQDVDAMQREQHIQSATAGAAWSGPKRLLGGIIAAATGLGALAALAKFWPAIIAALAV